MRCRRPNKLQQGHASFLGIATLMFVAGIGIPLMADMLNPVAAKALEDNSRAILGQLGIRAAAQQSADQPAM